MYFCEGEPLQNLKILLKTQNLTHFDLQELATMYEMLENIRRKFITKCLKFQVPVSCIEIQVLLYTGCSS